MSDTMVQEEAMNMSNEQAVQILIPMRNMMCDRYGCPISDAVFALDKAIEALSAEPVRHGKWLWVDGVRCSQCNHKLETTGLPSYCPNCGCRMDEE